MTHMLSNIAEYINTHELFEWRTVRHPRVKPNKYEVSNKGLVRTISEKKIMSIRFHRGYLSTQLMSITGKSAEFRIHRLVAYEFVEGYQDGLVVNHKDGIKTNNDYRNLEWVTQLENVHHANDTGLVNHINGERVNTAILSNDEVRRICNVLKKTNGNIKLALYEARIYNDKVTIDMIRKIKNKETWKIISDEYFDKFNGDVLNYLPVELSEKDREIIDMLKKKSAKKISKEPLYYKLKADDVRVICQSLLSVNGDTDLVFESLLTQIPNITKSIIISIKLKHTWKSISDEYFDDDRFRQRLTDDDAEKISQCLLKYKGDISKVLIELSDNPRINESRIMHILDKEAHVDISDKYFKSRYELTGRRVNQYF